jgi:type VI secretion system protein VasG
MSSRFDALLARLNILSRKALEAAASNALLRGEPQVTPEHWLQAMLAGTASSDVVCCAAYFGQAVGEWERTLRLRIVEGGRGALGRPSLSRSLEAALSEAWSAASLEHGGTSIRSGHILAAAVSLDPTLATALGLSSSRLREEFGRWTALSVETPASEGPASTPGLDRFSLDLTAAARAGALDPVVGREALTRELLEVLARRRQNNPLLLGDPGVGKTAIVEGLAIRMAEGEAPGPLRRASIRVLDLASIQAGAAAAGELESRLQQVLEDVRAAADPVVLFVDEAHTLFQLGAGAGALDAVNVLKPSLARGELRLIAATTHAEYKRHFERDAAFTRRFQVVRVEEPGDEEAVWILRGVAPGLARHHQVRIDETALEASVRLSRRYLAERQLPDKAISLLDTAAARVALSRTAAPGLIEEARTLVARLEESGEDDELAVAETRLADLEGRWRDERALVARIEEALAANENSRPLEAELARLQAGRPLVHASVSEAVIAEVVASWTGVPVNRIGGGEREAILHLRVRLGDRIAGQDHALDAVVKRILASRAGLDDEARPIGVFLLTGPSGTGKSELARALAEVLYSGERDLITIPLAEYQEAHSISGLRGAPPGYVGYGEGGVLTEALRRRPYSVVLLDEIEKAHVDVREFLYGMLDQGRLEDASGRRIDARNSIIFLTSNLGADRIDASCRGRMEPPSPAFLTAAVEPELRQVLRPALLGRMTVIPFYPLSAAARRQIAEWRLERLQARLWQAHRIEVNFDDSVADELAAMSDGGEGGARSIDRAISETLAADVSRQIVSGGLRPGSRLWIEMANHQARYRQSAPVEAT